jgi:hypothetical protein
VHRKRKLKWHFGTHDQDNAWGTKHLSLFTIRTVQCPTHCEWESSPHVNSINPTM